MNTCDHGHQTREEIRLLPLGGGANLHVCRLHWKHELDYRRKVHKAVLPTDLPAWETLELVQGAEP